MKTKDASVHRSVVVGKQQGIISCKLKLKLEKNANFDFHQQNYHDEKKVHANHQEMATAARMSILHP